MTNDLQKNGELAPKEEMEILSIELVPNLEEDELHLEQYRKLPFGEMSSLGAGLSGLGVMAQTIASSGSAGAAGETLYRIANSDTAKGTLQMIKGQPGTTYGTFMQNGQFSNRAIFEQVQGSGVVQSVPVDPTAIFMAAALASINQKLDAIQATQNEMFEYAKQRDESQMRGDLTFLSDVFNNYKNAWNNELYVQNNHAQALTCKRHAHANIDFYRQEIIAKTNENDFLHSDKKVEKKLEALEEYFKDYQMALTMFAFSSLMDVLLSKNFEKSYLESISESIREHSIKYRELYTDCYNQVAAYANKSVDSVLRKGLSKASKTTGEGLAKAPLLNKSSLDAGLLEVSIKLKEYDSDKRSEPLKALAENSSASVLPFVESIEDINRYHNEPMEVMFDYEYMYVPA